MQINFLVAEKWLFGDTVNSNRMDEMKLAILMSATDAFPERQLANACNLARQLDVTLTGIISSEDSIDYHPVGDGGYLAVLDNVAEVAEKKLQTCADRFRASCAAEQVAQEWFGTHGFMRHEWEELSPYFDLAITTGSFSAPEFAGMGISATLQLADQVDIGSFDGRCVIAWDGSVQAGRAVRSALPLMRRFAEVNVLSIDARNRSLPTDIGGYLAANGINADVLSLASGGETVARLILDEAKNADLLVMGAYGVSATLEKWFGGVTEAVRADCVTPVLFAH